MSIKIRDNKNNDLDKEQAHARFQALRERRREMQRHLELLSTDQTIHSSPLNSPSIAWIDAKPAIALPDTKAVERKIGIRLEQFFRNEDVNWVRAVFDRHKNKDLVISADRFTAAMQDLGVNVGADHQDLFQSLDLNGNGFLDFQEFRRCLNYDGELEQWAATLPLAPLLACCIPIDGRRPGSHIRELCELKDADIEMAMRAFADGARRVVAARLAELRAGFEELGRRAAAQTSGTSAKFETCEMACGSIDDFHRGIQERIGDRILCVSMRLYGTELADPELAVHG